MPPPSTFFRRLRLLWVGVNVAVLVITASGHRDLSALTVMLSFPAGVVAVILLPIDAWTGRGGLNNLLSGTVAFISGYVQWFVIGRAIAERILARFPSRRLLDVGRFGVVVLLLGSTFLGLVIVRAQAEENRFIDRALTVHEGMTIDEVRTILGDPKSERTVLPTDTDSLCPAGTARVTSYWYEHEWLPRGGFFLLSLCLDRQGNVIEIQKGHAN